MTTVGAEARGASCDTCGRSTWTCCYVLTWAIWLVGALVCHIAVANLVGPLKALPGNLHRGFYQELGFGSLETDSQTARAQSLLALQACNASDQLCRAGNLPQTSEAVDTSIQRHAILAAFTSSLSTIEKVASDRFLGTKELESTAEDLREISSQLGSLDTDQCRVTNAAYCQIYLGADGVVAEAQEALDEVNRFIDSEEVRKFEDNSDKIRYLHAFPYLLLLSMLFFFCFWKKDAACCCNGGSCAGCFLMVLHLIFWLAALIISFVIVVAALGFGGIRVKDLKGDPTVEELLDHIQTEYGGFFDIVFAPLESPLTQFFTANLIFFFVCILVSIYGACTCLCRPYTEKE